MLEIPEWVHVWAYLRFIRAPRISDALPEQQCDPDITMPKARFFDYLAEWKRAGSPRITSEHLQALGVNALYEPPPF